MHHYWFFDKELSCLIMQPFEFQIWLSPWLSKSMWENLFFFISSNQFRRQQTRPDQQQQPPLLTVFTVLDESLCIIITFPAFFYIKKKSKSERRGEEERWRVKYVPATLDVVQRNLLLALPWRDCVCVCARRYSSGWLIQWVEFQFEFVGVVTVWELSAHVEESCGCRNISVNGCSEGMGKMSALRWF